MLKRKVLKRVLPIMLSLAMVLQSVPMTAMAAELPVVSEEAETVESNEAAVNSESQPEGDVTADTDAESGETTDESEGQPEGDVTADTGAESGETTDESEGQPEDDVTADTGAESGETTEGSEEQPEITPEGTGAETVTEPEVGADKNVDTTADEGETSPAEKETGVAKIVVNDTAVSEWVGEENKPGGITRKLDESGLAFFTEYVDADKSQVGRLQNAIKDWIYIEVDGENVDLKDSLTYKWVKKADAEGGTDVPLADAMPVDAGTYELTISLDAAGTNGLCTKVEPADGVKLALTIEKARIELWLDTWTRPGMTVGDLVDRNNENYQVVYADRIDGPDGEGEYKPEYTVSKNILNIKSEDKKLPVHVYENDAGTEMQLADKFDIRKDYVLKINPDDIELADNAKANYELYLEDSYRIRMDEGLRETWVGFERKDAGEDLIVEYKEGTSYSIDTVTKGEGIFTEPVTDANGKVTKTGAPAVYVWDDKEEKDVILEGAELTPGWYTRIQVSDADNTVDEDAGEFGEDGYIYQPMKADPEDAGEYFIVWSYAGDEGAYEASRSEAVRFTIDPAPVVIKTDEKSVEAAGFRDGMTAEDVAKTIAKIEYAVYPIVLNEETKAPELGTSQIPTEPGFFGTSYGIENQTDMTQYFVPEFVLERMPVKMTEKGGKEVTVDEKSVDWTPTAALSVVVDEEDDEFDYIEGELPQSTDWSKLESVEFKFRVVFTGNKVVYDKDGNKKTFDGVPVTDVTTNAANKNYLADITKRWLDESAVELKLDAIKANDVTIDTSKIVKAFTDGNKEMLYPQPAEGADAAGIHEGSLAKPATKIYDRNGLFADRASYKQAAVKAVKEDGAETDIGILGTDEKFTYEWNYIDLREYEDYLKTWDEVQREYKDFDEYYFKTEEKLGWTNVEDGTLGYSRSPGVYRLTVTFDDATREYRSAKAEVFFKVERQEIIVLPTTVQYVGRDGDIFDFESALGNKLENRKDYIIYKLPHNSEEEFKNLKDDEKSKYEIPSEDELSLYETENGEKYTTKIINSGWKVLRKEKGSDGKDLEPAVWVEATGTFDDDFTYGFAATYTGKIMSQDGDALADTYTTEDVATYRATGEMKHHQSVGDVKFFDQKIYVEVDKDKIAALGHEYDGTAVDLVKVAEALTFYRDEALTDSIQGSIVNTTDVFDPTKINIYWVKYASDRDTEYTIYANKNAVYGGTYSLLLRFDGGALAKPAEAAQDDTSEAVEPTYAPLVWSEWDDDGNPVYTFTVTPRAITIKPELLSKDILKAGDMADKLVTGDLTLENVVENDKKFFSYAELAEGGFDAAYAGKNADGTDKESPEYRYSLDKNGGYPAFDDAADYVIQVDGREIRDRNDYLRAGKTYTVKLKNDLVSPLKESYTVTYAPNMVEVVNRGNAEVGAIPNLPKNSKLSNRIEYNFSDGTYVVMPREAVKFVDGDGITVQDRYGNDQVLKNTNILGFRIKAPKEFWTDPDYMDEGKKLREDKFVYQNAIWDAGGYFYNNNGSWKNRSIDVIFPLTKDNLDLSFDITWEKDYTETFTLADVVLEEDLTKAVAPKSMAFNGVMTKMAVGERQQLNLKITKAQLGDVIAVRYRIKDSEETKNDYISLDPETGVVTALKAGKVATAIEAYPVYKDAKGKFMPILDSKGKAAKSASTKITVTDVTASTIKKIVAQGDGKARLYFTVPDNGYRREIYVVDVTKGTEYEARKKWKPAQFNDVIDSMSNGDWKAAGFAVKPEYSYAKNNDLYNKELRGEYDKKLKAHITTIGGLEAEHEYAVYVRNVSAVRELHDGSVVTFSANGAVKSVKTTKPQVKELELGFTIKTGENDKKNTVMHPVRPDGSIVVDEYEVQLSAKKAQLNVYGLFSDKAGGNAAAEDEDLRRYSLVPTLKEEKEALKKYQMPKLEYAIFDEYEYEPFKPGKTQSKYAVISNKGLISLKGVDLNGEKTVYVYVRDNMQHQDPDDYGIDYAGGEIELTITAKAASVTGKNVKAVVGQTIRLADCLTYKDEKKKALPNYRSGRVTITPGMIRTAEENGYRVVDNRTWDEDYDPKWHDWYITPIAPNKAKFVLEVSDYDADGNLMTANVTFTSKQVDTVKGLKVTYADDKHITINFTHAANKNEADDGKVYQYAFEIVDARGNVVDKRILSNPQKISNCDIANAKELKSVQSWIQYPNTKVDTRKLKDNSITVVANQNRLGSFNYYTGTRAKTKTFAYTYTNEKLVRLSAYTITVTPLFENQKADKPAKTKAKTTNIPASYKNPDLTGTPDERWGGNAVVVTTTLNKQQGKDLDNRWDNVGRNTLNSGYWFTSGNTYTLKLVNNDNVEISRDRVTDNLTWKSSNTKVASIKANAGTYTATFKPVNQGQTTITVTSKVTKKVIARWAVNVCAIQDGAGYGGDYEPTWDGGFYENILALYDPYYDGVVEVLSMNVPLDVKDDGTWVSFTAPHYGEYDFSEPISAFYDSKDGRKLNVITNEDDASKIFLEEGQKVYFKANGGQLTVTGTELARLTRANTKAAPLEVKAGHVSFTAWEDNVYTFWLNGAKVVADQDENEEDLTEVHMRAGETRYIWAENDGKMYVTWRDLSTAAALGTAANVTLDKDNQARYISYTANVAGEYVFTLVIPEGVEHGISAANGDDLNQVSRDVTDKGLVESYSLEEGQKVIVEFRAEPEIKDAAKTLSASVTVTAAERKVIGADGKITIPKGTKEEVVKYVVPAFTTEKAQFKFEVAGEDGTMIKKCLNKNYELIDLVNDKSYTLLAGKDENVKAGDSIYILLAAGGEADDKDAKDAELKVTQISVKPLTANKPEPETIVNGGEYWYTFTAPKDGFYEFGVSVDKRADGDTTPLHNPTLALCGELFGTSDKGSAPKIFSLKSGEMLALRLKAANEVYKTNTDGTKEAATSNANVSVKELVVTPLALGETQVDLTADSKEVKYYSFTAIATANYTMAWKPADPKKDGAKVTFLNGDVTSSGISNTLSVVKPLDAGKVSYIKVEARNDGYGNAVNGKLCVTADTLNAKVLTVGKAEKYELQEEGGAEKQVFKFTAPKAGNYAIITTVDNNPDTSLPYDYPDLSWYDDEIDESREYVVEWFDVGQTRTFTVSLGNDTEKTAGSILIRSEAEEVTGDQSDVKVAYGVIKGYTFKITESGRYEFKADYVEDKAFVTVGNEELASAGGRYYTKNDEVTIYVKGNDDKADASVKLYAPAKITPVTLNVGENPIDVKAGETKYYEISTVTPKTYEFEVAEITGTAGPDMKSAVDNKNVFNSLNDGNSRSMSKNSKLFIKITSNSAKKDLKCKLNVTERRELKVGDNAVTLKAGETANLTFRAPETGYYSFRVDQPGAELAFGGKAGDSFYAINYLNAKGTRTYSLRNEGAGDVNLTVKIAAVTPIAVTPGSTTAALKVPAGEAVYYELKAFKAMNYLVKITDTREVADLALTLDSSPAYEKKIAGGYSFEFTGESNNARILRIENDGIKETEVTVSLAEDEAQPLPAEAITLAKNETKLISFVAPADNRYLISKDNDKVTMTLVKRWDADDEDAPTEMEQAVPSYKEEVLGKADKLVYKLSYQVDETDKKAAASQTVNVRIAPIDPTEITAASTPIKVDEKGNTSLWYQLTSKGDAIYTFSLEDEYGNEVPGKMAFYSYMTGNGESATEKFVKEGDKLIINLTGLEAGSYTLKYEEVKALPNIGTYTLDFEYQNEVQELKFVIPKGGSYKVSAAAFRGEFRVEGATIDDFVTANGRGSETTKFLSEGDIVTFTVTALAEGKSSVSIRITEETLANSLTLGEEKKAESSTKDDVYYEIRIPEKAMYAISADGAPYIYYDVNGEEDWNYVDGVVYREFDKDDKVVIKVCITDQKQAYAIKVAKISAKSLDGNDTEEKALAATVGENDYVFTKEKAYVNFTVPETGSYYIALSPIDGTAACECVISGAANIVSNPGMTELTKDEVVKFELAKEGSAARATDASLEKAMFRLTIKAALPADKNPIKVGEPKTDKIADQEEVSYQFTATEEARYLIDFEGSGCDLQVGDSYYSEGDYRDLKANDTLILKVKGYAAGSYYKLSVTKLVPEKLTLGVTASKTLEQGGTAYYEFDSTVTTDDGTARYQVYWSGAAEVTCDGVAYNGSEVTLGKGGKLSFKVENDGTTNVGFKLTVKEVKNTPITAADTAVSGSLEAHENAYYEFTSAVESKNKTPYQVSLETESAGVKIAKVQMVQFTGSGEDRKLDEENPVDVFIYGGVSDEVSLEKGEKLLITVANYSSKKGDYTLTVENKTEPAVTPTPIALGVKQTGKLNTDEEKAVYEFTADAEDTYSTYFNGGTCEYVWTTVSEPDADGKTETETYKGYLSAGEEFRYKKGDKITFTVRGVGKYELAVKKVAYTKLTAGMQVSKTLNRGETVYYEFISQDTPAAGEETTKYLVYGAAGSCAIQSRILTVGDDGKTDNPSWSSGWGGERDLKQAKQILQFKATNEYGGTTPFKLTVKKVEYKPLTLDTAVEGQFTYADDGYPYYEFTSTDTPAEGQTTTGYYVYGTGSFTYSLSRKDGEKITWENQGSGYTGMLLYLEKDQRVRFKVTSSPYSLTVAKQPEAKAITLNTPVKTGKLTEGQMLVYTLKHTADTPADYALDYEDGNVSVSAAVNSSWIADEQRFEMSKDDVLKVTITASDDVDDFTFTVKEFKPETLELGKTVSRVLDANETVYYQYTVGKTATYVVSKTSSGYAQFAYEVKGGSGDSIYDSATELDLTEKGTVLFKVSNPYSSKVSFKLTLAEKPAESTMTPLEVKNNELSLNAGEVKYLKFAIPEAEKAKDTRYVLYIPAVSGVEFMITSFTLSDEYDDETDELVGRYNDNVSDNFTICVTNTSMSAKNCSINLQQREVLKLDEASDQTVAKGDTVYYQYKAGAFAEGTPSGTYVVSVAGSESGVVSVRYRKNSAGDAWINDVQEISLAENDVLLLEAKAKNAGSYKLTLQKKPDQADMPALEVKDNKVALKAGEVKYVKFTVPEEEKGARYTLSIPKISEVKYDSTTVSLYPKYDETYTEIGYYNDSVTDDFTIRLANRSMFAKDCSINLKKPVVETLKLNEPVGKEIEKGETVYYQYTVADSATYVISIAGANPGDVTLKCKQVNGSSHETDRNIEEITCWGSGTLLVDVKANKATSYELTLKERIDKEAMETLPTNGSITLQPGEVKWFRYEVAEYGRSYTVSIPTNSDALRAEVSVDGSRWWTDNTLVNGCECTVDAYGDIIVRVRNVSEYSEACEIDVQKAQYDAWYSYSDRTMTITSEEATRYYESYGTYNAGDYRLNLTCEDGDVKAEYSTDSTDDKTWTALPADGRITLEDSGWMHIFLKVTYTGQDEERYYTLSAFTKLTED